MELALAELVETKLMRHGQGEEGVTANTSSAPLPSSIKL